jgi:hypothetical protein
LSGQVPAGEPEPDDQSRSSPSDRAAVRRLNGRHRELVSFHVWSFLPVVREVLRFYSHGSATTPADALGWLRSMSAQVSAIASGL